MQNILSSSQKPTQRMVDGKKLIAVSSQLLERNAMNRNKAR
jgi:hypothetical protein